jgi:hypothetical protein
VPQLRRAIGRAVSPSGERRSALAGLARQLQEEPGPVRALRALTG